MKNPICISSAISSNDGISFFSNRQKGWYAYAYMNEDGTVNAIWKTRNKKKYSLKEILTYSIGVAVGICFCYWFIKNKCLIYSIDFWRGVFLFGAIGTFQKVVYWRKENLRNNNGKFLRYHSAEHMLVNAVDDLKRIPTLTELKFYSRYSRYCGTNTVTIGMLLCLVFFICTFLPIPYAIMTVVLSYLALLLLNRYGFLNFMQRFTTSPATESELKVAIAGAKIWVENETMELK